MKSSPQKLFRIISGIKIGLADYESFWKKEFQEFSKSVRSQFWSLFRLNIRNNFLKGTRTKKSTKPLHPDKLKSLVQVNGHHRSHIPSQKLFRIISGIKIVLADYESFWKKEFRETLKSVRSQFWSLFRLIIRNKFLKRTKV